MGDGFKRYRLGLDVGTSSVGLAAFELDEAGRELGLIYSAVAIFAEPLLPPTKGGVGEPKKASRRRARQMRRQVWRKAQRLRGIANLFERIGLEQGAVASDDGQTIHELRARAAKERVELPELMRVFLKLAKRRGYRGELRERQGDKDKAIVAGGIGKLRAAMNGRLLGEYLAERFEQDASLKLKDAGLHAHRDMVEAEFNAIWDEQVEHHAVLGGRYKDRPLREHFHEAILFQRPLRSPEAAVGRCELEPGLPRAPRAHEAAQRFRIEKQIADLRWGMARAPLPLSEAQREVIRRILHDQKEVGFESLYKALEKEGCPRPPGKPLNVHRASRDGLTGNRTRAAWRALKLLDQWDALPEAAQVQVINLLADMGSPEQFSEDPLWHEHLAGASGKPRQFSTETVAFIDTLRQHPKFGRLTAMGFEGGRSAYSLKALRTLLSALVELGDEAAAIERCYEPKADGDAKASRLPAPEETGNVVVDVALRQVRKAVNLAIAKLGGPPAEVYVELARDVARSLSERDKWERQNARDHERRKKARVELEQEGYTSPGPTQIRRYLLWDEQGRVCPYCEHRLGVHEAISGRETEEEHILPRTLTQVGRRRNQLVLAHVACNHAKGDRTPWQAWGNGRDPGRWSVIVGRAEDLANHAKSQKDPAVRRSILIKSRLLLTTEYERGEIDEAAIEDFTERQLHETSWISRIVLGWMPELVDKNKVWVARGELTALLRREWGLDTVIAQARYDEGLKVLDTDERPIEQADFDRHRPFWEGQPCAKAERTSRRIEKRIDHRHHLVDAVVIALTTRSLYQAYARYRKAAVEAAAVGRSLPGAFHPPVPFEGLRDQVLVAVKSAEVWHKPDRHPGMAFFQASAYAEVESVAADGQVTRRLAKREKLASLAGVADSTEKARKALADIVSDEVRRIVTEAFDQRIALGQTPQAALAEPIRYGRYGNGIRRVLVFADGYDQSHRVVHRSRDGVELHKRLRHNGYLCLEVDLSGKGKPRTRLIPPVEGARLSRAAPDVTRFYKGDVVRDARDGKNYLVKQIKAEGGGQLIAVAASDAREVEDVGVTKKKVSGASLRALQVVNR